MGSFTRKDLAMAAGVGAIDLIGLWISQSVANVFIPQPTLVAQLVLIAVTIILQACTLLWRRYRPLLTTVVVLALGAFAPLFSLIAGQISLGYNGIAIIVATVSLALHTHNKWRDVGIIFAGALAIGALRSWLAPADFSSFGMRLVSVVGTVVSIALAYAVGLMIRNSQELNAALREQAKLAEENAVMAERSRIARELHDTTAHHLSAIAIQTNAARAVLEANPQAAAAHLEHISDSISKALADVRSTVGQLRESSAELQRRPQPALRDLPALLKEVHELGQSVSFTQDTTALGGDEQLAAYRIIQEALTNARKHAPGAPVSVMLSDTELGIHTLGKFQPGKPGRGTVSIAERAAAVGATASNKPVSDGWLVHVTWRNT